MITIFVLVVLFLIWLTLFFTINPKHRQGLAWVFMVFFPITGLTLSYFFQGA